LVPELLLQLIHPLVRVEMPPPASFTMKPANQKRQFTYFSIENVVARFCKDKHDK
jgi:hypothetical protein